MDRFRRGDNLPVRFSNVQDDGSVPNCDTGYPQYQLLDPAGKEVTAFTAVGFTSSSTGNYYVNPTAPTTSPAGAFVVNILAVTSSVTKKSQQSFIVD